MDAYRQTDDVAEIAATVEAAFEAATKVAIDAATLDVHAVPGETLDWHSQIIKHGLDETDPTWIVECAR